MYVLLNVVKVNVWLHISRLPANYITRGGILQI
jgi:hypothetical protein